MKRHICISVIALFTCIQTNAQTPYDSFSPETSRPMLGLDSSPVVDTILCAALIDTQLERILFVDLSDGGIIAVDPITDDLRKWLSVDPMADKYPSISPYAYCGWNPIKNVDPNGESVMLWTETEGVGHTWITTGDGENIRVYSYGRYDDLGKEKSSFRSLSSTGDGVLLRLTGDDAMLYQEGKIKQTNPISVVIQDITDEQMQNYFDNMFDTSIELPSKVSGAYYQNSNAHVIDTYNLFSNNCTTKAVQAINALGSTFFQEGIVPSPNGRGYELNINKQFTTPVGLCMFLKLK